MDYKKLFHKEEAFQRETFQKRMEEFGFKNMARMELFLWDLELFLHIQKILGENTGEMVSLLHPQLKEEGYEAVTVSQMIVKENYSMETDGRQIPESQNKAIFS